MWTNAGDVRYFLLIEFQHLSFRSFICPGTQVFATASIVVNFFIGTVPDATCSHPFFQWGVIGSALQFGKGQVYQYVFLISSQYAVADHSTAAVRISSHPSGLWADVLPTSPPLLSSDRGCMSLDHFFDKSKMATLDTWLRQVGISTLWLVSGADWKLFFYCSFP